MWIAGSFRLRALPLPSLEPLTEELGDAALMPRIFPGKTRGPKGTPGNQSRSLSPPWRDAPVTFSLTLLLPL